MQGDFRRFNGARGLALRLVSGKEESGIDSYFALDEYEEEADFEAWYEQDESWKEFGWPDETYYNDDSWDDYDWQDDGWYWVDDDTDYPAQDHQS